MLHPQVEIANHRTHYNFRSFLELTHYTDMQTARIFPIKNEDRISTYFHSVASVYDTATRKSWF